MAELDKKGKRKKLSEEESAELRSLVKKCSKGEPQALQEFFDRFSSDMYNFPIKVFHLDEDAASDYFIYAYERLRDGSRFRSYQGRASFRTWFYTVLRNLLIDWMRTVRELQTVQYNRTDEQGNQINTIEDIPDKRSTPLDDKFITFLQTNLTKMSMELRLVFKLSYIYYLNLQKDELEYLSQRSGKTVLELIHYIADIKNHLSEKELKNIDLEDKITALYIAILDLKSKREKILSHDASITGALPGQEELAEQMEMAKLNKAIEKKYQQREKLLEKKEKGHFVVKTPYKYISEMINIPEGSISVQMMRVLEKIRVEYSPNSDALS